MTILIVDDEKAVANSLQQLLLIEGYSAQAVTSGKDALAELSVRSYDIVLLDLHMPEMSGAETLKHIVTHHPKTCVMIVSGESELKNALEVLKNGAKEFIRKPYTPEELLFSLNNVIEKIELERENQRMLKTLQESEALHRFIVHNSPDLLYMLDHNGLFTFVNKNTLKHLGYSRNEIIGKHFTEVIYHKDLNLAHRYFETGLVQQPHNKLELRLQCKQSDRVLYVEVRAINIERKLAGGYKLGRSHHNDKGFVGTYGVARDITEKKRAQEIIRFQSNHDLLTGLPNRTLLNDRLSSLIKRAEVTGETFAVMLIDINRFKLINDTYSQAIGDKLLQQFAELLQRNSSPGETLARLGGDEFILLLPGGDPAPKAISRAEKIIADSSLPFLQDGHKIHINLSIGIATYPEHGVSAETLLKYADTAACNAKSRSGNPCCLYQPSLQNQNSQKVFTENLIRGALHQDRLLVYYQPVIDLKTKQLRSVEALSRILSEEGQIIPPGKFIEVAEETSLINDIGNVVLDKVCQDMTSWNAQGIKLPVAINVSAVQIQRDDFTDRILERIRFYKLRPQDFILELTENVLVQNMQVAIANIIDLTDCGIKIAIDDFGIGYSSLSYLDHLPLHTLKLDKSFIQKITEHNPSDTIIPAIIRVAEGLKLNFVAEGVETRQQHEYLLQHGGTIAQGYYYSYPLTKGQLHEFISALKIRSQQLPIQPEAAVSIAHW